VVLTVAVFLIEVVPLELQRRIVNDAVKHRDFHLIVNLCTVYVGVALVHGSAKLALNIYRAWMGQSVTRDLRQRIQAIEIIDALSAEEGGAEVSMVIAESEPVGQFIAEAVSEPLLQVGILASVIAYMVHLDPIMTLIAGAIFVPQLLFVPALQGTINKRAKDAITALRKLSSYILAATLGGDPSLGRKSGVKRTIIDHVFSLNMSVSELKYVMNFLMNFCTHLQIIAALLYGGWLVRNNELEVGGVVAFLSGLSRLTDPWGDLVNYFRDASVTRMKYLLLAGTVNQLAGRTRMAESPDSASCATHGDNDARP
jgi:ABC-type bacteriocin/lantibiotic exporter with double-glycine peptidase domain